jgi:hypothetical protein
MIHFPAEYTRHIISCLNSTLSGYTRLPKSVFDIHGFSSPYIRILLNNLCNFSQCKYLEIGSWHGSTLISASHNNKGSFIGIDNFSEFEGETAKNNFKNNLANHRDTSSTKLIESDCWLLDPLQFSGTNVYFYDGAHTRHDQFEAFRYYHNCFAKNFIAVVDDWNWEYVREGTLESFKFLNYKVKSQFEFFSDFNGDVEGWWNGIMIAHIEKQT